MSETREKIDFYITLILKLGAAVLAVVFGTAHLAKFDQEQLLKSKLVASTNISFLKHGTYISEDDTRTYCDVSGRYDIKNTGKYPFIVHDVSFQLWKLPYIQVSQKNAAEVISYTLSERIDKPSSNDAKLVAEIKAIPVGEQFGINNELQRSFGFIVPIPQEELISHQKNVGPRYVVVANANAGIDARRPWYSELTHMIAGDPGIGFLPNDLRHFTATFNICETYPNVQTENSP